MLRLILKKTTCSLAGALLAFILATPSASAAPEGTAANFSDLLNHAKNRSCMFNSIVWPVVEDRANYLTMLNRSRCKHLPRAIELWLQVPVWSAIDLGLSSVRAGAVGSQASMGVFIAEAIRTNQNYTTLSGAVLSTGTMCRSGTVGYWGANTCIPDLSNANYRTYVRDVVTRSLQRNVQEFMFGQTQLQDPYRGLPSLITELRAIAASQGKAILIGGQTNDDSMESYLRSMDYILTGLVQSASGALDYGACIKEKTTFCQANHKHGYFLRKANNVILELDWSSFDDDIHRFALLSANGREQFLVSVARELRALGVGQILPFRIPLSGGSSPAGCRGFNQYVFSADNRYTCKTEDTNNRILNNDLTSPLLPIETDAERILAKKIFQRILTRDADASGLQFYADQMKAGRDPRLVAGDLIYSPEFQALFASKTNTQFVEVVYKHILYRDADAGGLAFYVGQLDSGAKNRPQVAFEMIYSPEFSGF